MRFDINSVQQVVKECNEMLQLARELNYVDTNILSGDLEERIKDLVNVYDNNPEDKILVTSKKVDVEKAAISLEYFIQARTDSYRDRYALRKFANTLYEDVRIAANRHLCSLVETGDVVKSSDNVKHLQWTDYLSYARTLKVRSLRLIFNTYDEDEEMIKIITKALKEDF